MLYSLLNRLPRFPVYLVATLVSVGITSQPTAAQTPPPLEVTVVDVKSEDTPAVFEFTGKTESSREVVISARVTGYIEKIAYEEGAVVQQGDLLFQLDPRPFKAALDNAKGVLAQEQAKLKNARRTLERIKPLARENAVSQKDLDDGTAAVLTAQAAVQSAKAQVDEAEINLGYATIRSPLTGLAGRSEKREGSLVTAGQDSQLTTIVRLDPIWVNFSVGENEVLKFRQERDTGKLRDIDNTQVELVLADGSVYPEKGIINYVAPSIDRETGTLALRGELPNSKGVLSPGLFVRVRLEGAVRTDVLMVPQRSVMQGAQGKFVYVVDEGGKAEAKPVQVGDFYGDQWIVTGGLNGGEQVVVDGAIKIRPDSQVKIVPAKTNPPATSQQ
ncbi:MAG: efflux RND transporter periplasmic adaptor subunit [Candidatus Competibacteraceae bacterium]|nr:efflux RND transporter periplasmic adaptor subunit [Candidatus Competibacteraceae bacterium]